MKVLIQFCSVGLAGFPVTWEQLLLNILLRNGKLSFNTYLYLTNTDSASSEWVWHETSDITGTHTCLS